MVLNMIPRRWRKRISIGLFIFSLLLITPPGFPAGNIIDDIILNIPIATFLSQQFGITNLTALLFSYTLVPLAIFYLAAIIHPTDTTKTFNGQLTKVKNFFIKYINLVKKNPVHLAWLIISLYIFYRIMGFYQTQINIFILS